MLRNLKNKAQIAIEYVMVFIVIMGVFVAMGVYFRQGLQGRWKGSLDSMGEQYDPRDMNTNIRYGLSYNVDTTITTIDDARGYWSTRLDVTNQIERKTGDSSVVGY